MARYVAESIYIASIYPGELEPVKRNYGPTPHGLGKDAARITTFRLEPVLRGKKPFFLKIDDSFESVIHFGGQRGERVPKPVPAEEICSDLLQVWTGNLYNVPQGAKPGVMQISGTIPTTKEMEEMTSVQSLYFEYLFTEGERLHRQASWKEITGAMRLAAQYLGHAREWSHQAIARDSGPCPICTAIIPNAAFKCPSCQTILRKLPDDIAGLQQRSA